MNNKTNYILAIVVALCISFIYNTQLTLAIFLANMATIFVIKDNDIINMSEEELMKMLPKSIDDIGEMVLREVLRGAVNTCFIVAFYHCIHTIYG